MKSILNLYQLTLAQTTDGSKPDTWTLLSGAVCEILNGNASHLSFEENYRYAYNMVLHKQGSVLYEGVKKLLTENLDKLAKEVIVPTFPSSNEGDPVQQTQEGEMLLKAFLKVWNDYKMGMQKLRDLLKYMVRVILQIVRKLGGLIIPCRTGCTLNLRRYQPYGTQGCSSS